MAIKINGKDLAKRIINGQEVEKVMANGVQIRPTGPSMTPGSYWNPTLGVISLSRDGINRITIADKNLGATTVYNTSDTFSEANCGKYYQRGNCYGFPFDGQNITSYSNQKFISTDYSGTRLYSNSTFYGKSNDKGWIIASVNDVAANLWNKESPADRRNGPCPAGFHIPDDNELYSMFACLMYFQAQDRAAIIKMPYGGFIDIDCVKSYEGINFGLWSCTGFCYGTVTEGTSVSKLYYGYNNTIYYADQLPTSYAASIRPFSNTSMVPDSTWTVLFQVS